MCAVCCDRRLKQTSKQELLPFCSIEALWHAEAQYIPIPKGTLALGGGPGLVSGSFGASMAPPGGML